MIEPGDAHDQAGNGRPEQRVEGVHGEQMRQGQRHGGQKHRQTCQEHGPAAAAQGARKPARQHDGGGAGKSGKQVQGPERRADGVLQKPGYPADERRLIDITPGRMLPASQVIQFIAEIAVLGAGCQV